MKKQNHKKSNIKCKICNQIIDTKHFGIHLRKNHNYNYENKTIYYYNKYLKKENEGLCKVCNKKTKYKNVINGYQDYCSNKCSTNSIIVQEKVKQTCLKNFGVTAPSKSNKVKNKAKQTKLEKYGNENYVNINKYKKNYKKKHGVSNPFQLEQVKNKAKQTKLEKYGNGIYNNPDKIKKTKLKKYGDKNYNNRNKYKETCLDKYGVDNPFKFNKIKENNIIKSSKTKQINILNGIYNPSDNYNKNKRIKIKYNKNYYRSSWEVLFQLLNPNCEYEKVRIKYHSILDNKDHVYITDFVDYNDKIIYEIKPTKMMELPKNQEKEINLKKWCIKNYFKYIHLNDDWYKENKNKININEYITL